MSHSASSSGGGRGPCSQKEIGAVPAPTVPVWSVVAAAAAALVLANAAAILPGRRAARTATVLVLNDE